MKQSELAYSMRLRDIVRRIASEQIDKLRPRYRYAVVTLIDRPNRKCSVIFNGETTEVTVNMGSIQPKEIGQTVRVGGIGTDKYIEDILGDNHITAPEGGTPVPTAATYKHTQSAAAATWTITHNLDKYPAVVVAIAGEQVYADVDFASLNQVTVTFPTATTGTAHLV